jgi:hypothetical protein
VCVVAGTVAVTPTPPVGFGVVVGFGAGIAGFIVGFGVAFAGFRFAADVAPGAGSGGGADAAGRAW